MSSWWQRLRGRLAPARPADESRVTATGYFADSVGPTGPASVEQAVDRAWRQRETALAAATDPGDWWRLATAYAESKDPALRRRAWEQHARIETAVGATLVECVCRHELEVDWDGSHETRPSVRLRDWRKPLPVEP